MMDVIVGVVIGIVAGLLSGLFGVGGGIVMTPGIQMLLGTSPIVALATPLPAILPAALTGALTYRACARGGSARPGPLLMIGVMAGLMSGLLGIGGGIVMVPLLSGWLGIPLKLVLGTSLAAIVALALPGAVVHAALGNIDGTICISLIAGAVPGARTGARLALGTRERTLRVAVGWFLFLVAALYGTRELAALVAR